MGGERNAPVSELSEVTYAEADDLSTRTEAEKRFDLSTQAILLMLEIIRQERGIDDTSYEDIRNWVLRDGVCVTSEADLQALHENFWKHEALSRCAGRIGAYATSGAGQM